VCEPQKTNEMKTIRSIIYTLSLAMLMAIPQISFSALIDATLVADTFIDSDNVSVNGDGDADNELLVATLTDGRSLRTLLRFDLSPITALGAPGDLVINSVTLTGKTGSWATLFNDNISIEVREYGFDFGETTATWNDPTGDGSDTTVGGTLGTVLSSQTGLSNNPGTVVFPDSSAFQNSVSNSLAGGTLNLLLLETAAGDDRQLMRFEDEDRPNPFQLTVDVTVIPESSTLALFGIAGLSILLGVRSKR